MTQGETRQNTNLTTQSNNTDVSSSSSDPRNRACAICHRSNCNLQTHREYARQIMQRRGRQHDQPTVTRTSFAYSYAFNPLAVAIRYVCGELKFASCPDVLEDNVNLSFILHTFIKDGISRNIPFSDPSGACDVSAQWLMAAAADELACTSTLILWATIEWNKTRDPKYERFCTRLNALFLVILRNRVEGRESVSPGTIFAASNHLSICSMYFDQTEEQRNVMMTGLEALVNQSGGLQCLEDGQVGLLQSLLWSDVLHCWNTGSRPRFQVPAPSHPPPTLVPMLIAPSNIPEPYINICGPDLLESAKYLRFFLLFRHSNEVRALTKVEYRYMVQLERFIHFQLLEQQARYHLTDSISECIILAMAIVRMSVLCIWDQHAQVRKIHAWRLNRALGQVPYDMWAESDDGVKALVWVCWVILAQSESCYDQHMALTLMVSGLEATLGQDHEEWPHGWESGFASSFMPLLWHSDYTASIPRVAGLIVNFKALGKDLQETDVMKVED